MKLAERVLSLLEKFSIKNGEVGKEMVGKVLWVSVRDENGIIIDDKDNEFYFDISTVNPRSDFQKIKRKDKVSFKPSRVSGTLAAKEVSLK